MEYVIHYHKCVENILVENPDIYTTFNQLLNTLKMISEENIIFSFENSKRKAKSISETIYKLIEDSLWDFHWDKSTPIFVHDDSKDNQWVLDYEKNSTSVNISIGHSSNIIRNLIIPVIAVKSGEMKKNTNVKLPIVITVTKNMKKAGGFDGAVGEYERYVKALETMSGLIDVPLVIIGLHAPKSFHIIHCSENNRKIGHVIRNG